MAQVEGRDGCGPLSTRTFEMDSMEAAAPLKRAKPSPSHMSNRTSTARRDRSVAVPLVHLKALSPIGLSLHMPRLFLGILGSESPLYECRRGQLRKQRLHEG